MEMHLQDEKVKQFPFVKELIFFFFPWENSIEAF